MTIKEVEQRTGLPRSVIRFYEKEGLIAPQRNEDNRYRDYSQADVDELTRIAFLRTLEIPLTEIGRVRAQEVSLRDVACAQAEALRAKGQGLMRAAALCDQLAEDAPESLTALDVTRYTAQPEAYVRENRSVLLRDCESFARWFGGTGCFFLLLVLSALVALWAYPKLPPRIPIQWDHGEVTGSAPRLSIFGYTLAIALIRLWLSGLLRVNCQRYFGYYGDLFAAYAVNGLCLLTLCAEVFTVLYVYGAARSVDTVLLAAGAFVLVLLALVLRGTRAKS